MDALPDDTIVYYMSYDQIAVVFEIPSGEVHPFTSLLAATEPRVESKNVSMQNWDLC